MILSHNLGPEECKLPHWIVGKKRAWEQVFLGLAMIGIVVLLSGCSNPFAINIPCDTACQFLKTHECVRGHEEAKWDRTAFVCDEYVPVKSTIPPPSFEGPDTTDYGNDEGMAIPPVHNAN